MEIGNIQPLALCPSGANPTSMIKHLLEELRESAPRGKR